MAKISVKQRKVNEELFGNPKPKATNRLSAQQKLAANINDIKYYRQTKQYSVKKLSNLYNVTFNCMSYFLCKNNLYIANHKVLPKETLHKMLVYYTACHSMLKVSQKFGLSYDATQLLLHKRVKQINPSRDPYVQKTRQRSFQKHIKYYYDHLYVDRGFSIPKIAKRAKISTRTVSKIFSKNHLQTYKQGPRQKKVTRPKKPIDLVKIISSKLSNNKKTINNLNKRCNALSSIVIQQSKELECYQSQQAQLESLSKNL